MARTECAAERISAQEVQGYLLFLHEERGLTWQSCNCARHGIRFLYRITLGLPELLNHDELVQLFGVTTNCKHRSVLMTAYAAGLRASELSCLRISDIDSQRMCVRVDQGKGNKDRYVPLSPRLLDELRAYWRRVRPEHWLFPGHYGHPMSRSWPTDIYNRAKNKAGIDKRGGVHTLRHTCAVKSTTSLLVPLLFGSRIAP